jgi:hypothetical protein
MNDPMKTEKTITKASPIKQGTGDILFCTGYIGKQCQIERYDLWIDYYLPRLDKLGCRKMVIIDDGSPLEHVVKLGIPIIDVDELPDELPGKVCWIRFPDNLGRPVVRMIPGWWRSFSFAALLALNYDAQRLIHIESDAFVFPDKLFDYLKTRREYWTSLYSEHYRWPETSIQVIPGKARMELMQFYQAGKDYWYGAKISDFNYIPEYRLPIHEISKDFKGDRMGEDWCSSIPADVDFVANMNDVSLDRVQHKMQEAKMKWLKGRLEMMGL